MKKYLILSIFLFTLIYACEKDTSLTGPNPSGKYMYQSYDTLGTLIVNGWMVLERIDSVSVEGTWHFINLNNRSDIGLQYGDGDLIGFVEDSSIFISLNPQYADHNVYLNGIIQDDKIEGEWIWSTFFGATNWGTFRASRN